MRAWSEPHIRELIREEFAALSAGLAVQEMSSEQVMVEGLKTYITDWVNTWIDSGFWHEFPHVMANAGMTNARIDMLPTNIAWEKSPTNPVHYNATLTYDIRLYLPERYTPKRDLGAFSPLIYPAYAPQVLLIKPVSIIVDLFSEADVNNGYAITFDDGTEISTGINNAADITGAIVNSPAKRVMVSKRGSSGNITVYSRSKTLLLNV